MTSGGSDPTGLLPGAWVGGAFDGADVSAAGLAETDGSGSSVAGGVVLPAGAWDGVGSAADGSGVGRGDLRGLGVRLGCGVLVGSGDAVGGESVPIGDEEVGSRGDATGGDADPAAAELADGDGARVGVSLGAVDSACDATAVVGGTVSASALAEGFEVGVGVAPLERHPATRTATAISGKRTRARGEPVPCRSRDLFNRS